MSRKTYVYDETLGKMVEGRSPSRSEGSGDGWRFSDRTYSGSPFEAPDGTVIDSRRKHREYMKRTGLTTADDFKGTWERKKQERAEFYTGTSKGHRQEVRQDLINAFNRRG